MKKPAEVQVILLKSDTLANFFYQIHTDLHTMDNKKMLETLIEQGSFLIKRGGGGIFRNFSLKKRISLQLVLL
jgi:hypothetical protein